jgi:dihydrofolate synthase/folylpolyglutamate synthase
LTTPLDQSLKRIEQLITRPAESYDDPEERQVEFQRRLERTRRLMAALGDPQNSMHIIHIGGTSGKGSIAIFCEAMLCALGLRVGTHTSPYLQTPLEKARVDGRLIASEEAIALTGTVLEAVETLQQSAPGLGNPHYAEAWLGLVLRHFADQHCAAGVIEVGMGGRYDATNIVTPRVSVISTVHYDHTRVLGETLGEIAAHKAGIIKSGVPVVVGEVPDAAWEVIEREARQRGSRTVRLGRDYHFHPVEMTADGGTFTYEGPGLRLDNVRIGLLGAHQLANASAALAAVELYATMLGLPLDETALRSGLAAARFAGRLEVMQTAPLVILDGAHNQEKMAALAAALHQVFTYQRLVLVLGMLEAKIAEPILAMLAPLADVIITTQPSVKGKPAIAAADLAAAARAAGVPHAEAVEDPHAALHLGLSLAGPSDLVAVTGSLYLIGTVRSHWHPTDQVIARRSMLPNARSI